MRLARVVDLPFKAETPLEDVIQFIRASTRGGAFPEGIPIYVDPVGLQEAERTMASPITFDVPQVPLRKSLELILRQLDLAYQVNDGLLTIGSNTVPRPRRKSGKGSGAAAWEAWAAAGWGAWAAWGGQSR